MGVDAAQFEEPSTLGGVVSVETDEPYADDHSEELEQAVHDFGSKDGAGGWDRKTPGTSVEVVSADTEGAGVGPGELRGLAFGDLVEG